MSPLTLPMTPPSYHYSGSESAELRTRIRRQSQQSQFANRTNQKAVIAGVTVAVVVVLSIFALTVFVARRWWARGRRRTDQPSPEARVWGADGSSSRALTPISVQDGPSRRRDTMVNGVTDTGTEKVGQDSEPKRGPVTRSEEKVSPPLPLKISVPRPLSTSTGNPSPLAERSPSRRNRGKSTLY
jgi:hypothetical protein